ncbi:Protein ANTAGONIST OF LIKE HETEROCHROMATIN PROTEIN 1 [Labeo rohita]|uniref:Protein ANTAGONIST OF LIKE HETEROCHROMATIN PROTEIN 1 n=1 Tax=Labeo rohita TaxID=84645 RepID=A0ABQ8L560_LABRO|nr:Protein ANTAGONIST OF LIKE HETEROCHROMATIN PROTEIN 1 [Labeo rohita]
MSSTDLATGESFTSLAFQYRLGIGTFSESVHLTCRAIEQQMMASQFPRPTEDMWRAIALKVWEKWNFPNCLGAINGKHITIVSPAHSGSLFFNYKRSFSIVLLALTDADYRFTFVQTVLYQDPVYKAQCHNAAFPLKPWRVFHTRMNVKPENADCIVTAACILNNYLTNPSENQRWLDEAEERGEVLPSVRNMGGNRGCREAYGVREKLCTFSAPQKAESRDKTTWCSAY